MDINETPEKEYLNAQATNTINEEFSATSNGVIFVWANRGFAPRSFIVKINNEEKINYTVVENTNPLRKVIPFKNEDTISASITGRSVDDYVGIYYYK